MYTFFVFGVLQIIFESTEGDVEFIFIYFVPK